LKSILLYIIFIFTSGISSAQTGWFVQSSSINDSLRSVRFINSYTGFAAGSNGTFLKKLLLRFCCVTAERTRSVCMRRVPVRENRREFRAVDAGCWPAFSAT
jgi:hypothetical protein